jgi:hypothetical protein
MSHDVSTFYDARQARQEISDEAVLAFATLRWRKMITLNRADFVNLY